MVEQSTPEKIPDPEGSGGGDDVAPPSGSEEAAATAIIPVDGEAEKKLVQTLDWRLIPIIMCLYLFSFLDR